MSLPCTGLQPYTGQLSLGFQVWLSDETIGGAGFAGSRRKIRSCDPGCVPVSHLAIDGAGDRRAEARSPQPRQLPNSVDPPAIPAGPRKPASAAVNVGSGREFRFLPRAGARFPPKFTPSTRLSRPRRAAGRALPLPALPFGMHGHSKDQNRKARPSAERGRDPARDTRRRVTNDRREV